MQLQSWGQFECSDYMSTNPITHLIFKSAPLQCTLKLSPTLYTWLHLMCYIVQEGNWAWRCSHTCQFSVWLQPLPPLSSCLPPLYPNSIYMICLSYGLPPYWFLLHMHFPVYHTSSLPPYSPLYITLSLTHFHFFPLSYGQHSSNNCKN